MSAMSTLNIPLLTEGEAKVYTALVELGETSIGNILKIAKVSHSKIYDILERLVQKGLVSTINKNGRQYFSPAEPSRLLELVTEQEYELQNKREEMKNVVNTLKVRQGISKPTSILSSYSGIKGMKTVLEKVLSDLHKNEEVLILGTPQTINRFAGGYIKEWQRRRIKIGARCRLITDADTLSWDYDWWEKSKKDKVTFTKRTAMISPAYFVITNTQVVTIYFSTVILSLRVEHPEIAQRYKEFFDLFWKTAQ